MKPDYVGRGKHIDCRGCAYEHVMAESIPCQSCLSSEYLIHFTLKPTGETMKNDQKEVKSAEDKARDILSQCGFSNAYSYSAGDLASLANLISEYDKLKLAVGGGSDHPLYEAFDDAVKQATKGKGVRHGGEATPFLTQPIFQIAKHTGVGGLIFQMVKKAQEACGKDDQEAFERELLGALVYGGAAYLFVKQHGFKKGEK